MFTYIVALWLSIEVSSLHSQAQTYPDFILLCPHWVSVLHKHLYLILLSDSHKYHWSWCNVFTCGHSPSLSPCIFGILHNWPFFLRWLWSSNWHTSLTWLWVMQFLCHINCSCSIFEFLEVGIQQLNEVVSHFLSEREGTSAFTHNRQGFLLQWLYMSPAAMLYWWWPSWHVCTCVY